MIIIASRDPTTDDSVECLFWLNYVSKELFEYKEKWVSLTKEHIKLHPSTCEEKKEPSMQYCNHMVQYMFDMGVKDVQTIDPLQEPMLWGAAWDLICRYKLHREAIAKAALKKPQCSCCASKGD